MSKQGENNIHQLWLSIICQYLLNKRYVIEISIFTCTIAVRCSLFCDKCFQFVRPIFLLTCRHVKQIKRADTEGFCSFSCSVWHRHLWNWRNRDYRWDIRRSSDCGDKFCATLLPADCLHGRAGEILEEIQIIKASTWSPVIYLWSLLHCGIPIIGIAEDTDDMSTGEIDSNHSTPAHCLRLPGRILDLKALLKKKSSESLTATRKGLLQHFLSSRLQN